MYVYMNIAKRLGESSVREELLAKGLAGVRPDPILSAQPSPVPGCLGGGNLAASLASNWAVGGAYGSCLLRLQERCLLDH